MKENICLRIGGSCNFGECGADCPAANPDDCSFFLARTPYVGNTFSPLMLKKNHFAEVTEITLADARWMLLEGFRSCISHEVTAKVLAVVLHQEITFNRINVSLKAGDTLIAVIPSFRAEVAREFTEEEVLSAPLRCFRISVH